LALLSSLVLELSSSLLELLSSVLSLVCWGLLRSER